MRIGVLSDTHDKTAILAPALHYFVSQQVALVVHCGDWKSLATVACLAEAAAACQLPVRGVLGNNDSDVAGFLAYARTAPGDFVLYEGVFRLPLAEGYLAAYHGHHKPTLRSVLADTTCSIVLLGHSHKPLITNQAGRLVVNPGSTAFAIPRSKSWQPSVAIVDTAPRQAEITYLT